MRIHCSVLASAAPSKRDLVGVHPKCWIYSAQGLLSGSGFRPRNPKPPKPPAEVFLLPRARGKASLRLSPALLALKPDLERLVVVYKAYNS